MTTKTTYTKEQIHALQCAGKFLGYCLADPDPAAQDKYQIEFNCANCDSHPICVRVLEALAKS